MRDNENGADLPFISFPIARQTTVYLPILYRQLPKLYVDDLFDNGNIQLSSLKKFRSHPDEIQGDKSEGWTHSSTTNVSSNFNIGVSSFRELNAYILSFSCTNYPMNDTFGDSRFEVLHPIDLANAIAQEIPGCISIEMGACIYVENLIIHSKNELVSIDNLKSQNLEGIDFNKIASFAANGPREYFIKRKKYQDQMEYRIIWSVNRPVKDTFIVNVPGIEKFCRRPD